MANTTQSFYTVKDVPAQDFIKAYAEYLKKNDKIKIPAVPFITNQVARSRKDFQAQGNRPSWRWLAIHQSRSFFPNSAAVARKIYIRGNTGVGLLKHLFGGYHRPESSRGHHTSAAGKIIRYCLQQLEEIKVLKKDRKAALKMNSRIISDEGKRDMNLIANEIAKKNLE